MISGDVTGYGHGWGTAYAVSKDGVRWEKPNVSGVQPGSNIARWVSP